MKESKSDLEKLKTRLKETWSSGDYGAVAKNLEKSAGELLKGIPFEPGTRLLDVACGTGQIAFPAARAGAEAVGVDIAPNLIVQAREKARKEGIDIQFDEGDAEQLSYGDSSFDLVVSLIGAMFAPRPERVASELLRVCRPGGRVVMWNWTPGGFIGKMFKTNGKHVPPPPMPSPLLWGTEEAVRERFSAGISSLKMEKRMYTFFYPFSPEEVVEFYGKHFGPTIRALEVLDEKGRAALKKDLVDLWSEHNTASDGTTLVKAEILEVVAVKEG